MDRQELFNIMTLTRIHGLGLNNAKVLFEHFGSATALMEHRNDILDVWPEANPKLLEILKNVDEAQKRADTEMLFIENNNIRPLVLGNDDYPARMAECNDCPLVLFYIGTADLNAPHIINIVGTRHATEYGRSICKNFIAELKDAFPDVVIVSGLAYGIDINAHRAALTYGLDTVGVVAHGLDTIYPSLHRHTASQMVSQGGLLTEYMSNTNADKGNFIRRNRIIAGVSDATVVVESAEKGGALVTADIALSYGRDVLAFPGRIYDQYSEGCNKIINNNTAKLIRSAKDLADALCWNMPDSVSKPRQLDIFTNLTEDEAKVVNVMRNMDSVPINYIVVEAQLSYGKVSSLLLDLEMKGVVKVLGGARYKLLPAVN